MVSVRGGLVMLLLPIALVLPAGASAQYAPVDRAGPELSVPTRQLAAALSCGRGVDNAARAPVLLVHGTGATVRENWSWNYQPAFDSLDIPWCAVQMPERGDGDIQVNAEYVLYAIRDMHRRAGRKISIVGHSQGGMVPRWPLRFWPDTRAMVDDQIGFAPSNHGTTQSRPSASAPASPAGWQQSDRSNFLRALNSVKETFAGISYTAVYTRMDEIVTPPEAGALRTGDGRITNVAIQDICPVQVADHFLIGLTDTVAFALALDALNHDGPASVERVARKGCSQDPIPGLQPTGLAEAAGSYVRGEGGAADVPAEPALRCYVTDTCARAQQRSKLRVSLSGRRPVAGRRARLHLSVRAKVNGKLGPVAGAKLRVGNKRVKANATGKTTFSYRFRTTGRKRVSATALGYGKGAVTVRVARAR